MRNLKEVIRVTKLNVNREGKIKLILSLLVLAGSVYVAIAKQNILPFIAMFFSSIGDINIMASRGALTGKKEKTFDWGVVAFAAAHAVYIYAMGKRPVFVVISIVLFVAVLILTIIKPENAKWHFIPYTLILFTSLINSWLFAIIAGIGMVLFLLSDLTLSIFEEKGPKWQIPIWVEYIPAQILMQLALLLEKTV